MPIRSSSGFVSQSNGLSQDNHLLTSPTSLPPARIIFSPLPQLSSDSTTVPLPSPQHPLPPASPVPSLYINNVSSAAGHPLSLNPVSSIGLHTLFSERQTDSSALSTELEPYRHLFSHGFTQLASWINSLLAVSRSQKVARDGEQHRNRTPSWSEGLSFSKQRGQSGREKLYCSIGLSGGVGKICLSQAEESLVSDNHSVVGSSIDAQSLGTREASEKYKEGDTGAVRNAAFKTTKHLSAGAIAAIVSRTVVAPLERLKLEYMVRGAQRNVLEIIHVIVTSEGLGGFWRGNLVNLLRTAPFKSINFFCYDIYRKKLLEITAKEEVTNVERLVAGAAAGVSATLICFPMDTIRTRMIAPGGEALGGVIGCFHHMLHTEGFFSLYKGLLPAVISMAPSGAIFYGVYDILKTSYLQSPEGKEDFKSRVDMEKEKHRSEREIQDDLKEQHKNFGQLELGPMRTLLYGAIAGICAETVTYPFEVVRRQLQMQDAASKMGALATCRDLVRRGGLCALYAGLLPSSLQVLPSAALSYFLYESMKIMLKVS